MLTKNQIWKNVWDISMIVTGTLSIQEFQVKELVVEDILRWFVIISVSVQIQKGKYHGVIDTGLAVVSYKNPRRIDPAGTMMSSVTPSCGVVCCIRKMHVVHYRDRWKSVKIFIEEVFEKLCIVLIFQGKVIHFFKEYSSIMQVNEITSVDLNTSIP